MTSKDRTLKKPEYANYTSAKKRCSGSNNPHYGGRGIEFKFDSFEEFYAELGPRPTPTHSVDRIDNERGYEPGNVRWATPKQQANNRRFRSDCRLLTHEGITQTVQYWSKKLNINHQSIRYRLDAGWSDEKILTTPIKRNN